MTTIYHNPRCSKSRECLLLLENQSKEVTVVNYIKDPLSKAQIEKLIKLLGINPIDLVRTNETEWKENYKGKKLTDAQIITALQKHPKLIQRPIVVQGDKAVIARPAEVALSIL
ncbi:arsenate reductase (glutaredoxin) [Constantimarinum furrinae]|uniref:Arsenate reductase n=1 Tax=Constantimarinum furrinae TaxID=2562285 RepID=A0A7G8PW86_9FLAO|nr:arsenate reductase (glutaredoxin) [Constantimarinum furrinae]QNJ98602.1 Arsenate reductase [Constantimarinum furrinae]